MGGESNLATHFKLLWYNMNQLKETDSSILSKRDQYIQEVNEKDKNRILGESDKEKIEELIDNIEGMLIYYDGPICQHPGCRRCVCSECVRRRLRILKGKELYT